MGASCSALFIPNLPFLSNAGVGRRFKFWRGSERVSLCTRIFFAYFAYFAVLIAFCISHISRFKLTLVFPGSRRKTLPTITVEGKVIGQKRPLFADWVIPFEQDSESQTLRSLIARVVQEEAASFNQRQEIGSRILILTQADIQRGLMKGKVDMGGRAARIANTEEALATAIQAFEDGVYYVFIDEEQVVELDSPMNLLAESRVTFLRLVALAGG